MIFLYLFLLAATPAPALDTLQVTSPDPVLEDWRWDHLHRRKWSRGRRPGHLRGS